MSEQTPLDQAPLDAGTPVGRRVVLGLIGLGALGVAGGSALSSGVGAIAAKDPTGVTALIPGGGGYRYYTVTGPVAEVAPASYSLKVSARPDAAPVNIDWATLAKLPQTTITKDVQCVTGWRVANQTWSGVLLKDLLVHAGADLSAAALTFGSFDGTYTESLTMQQGLRPDVLVATSLDGAPIPNEHGGPVRLYVAPMYFYKSLKWLGSVSVVPAVEPGYWEKLGYDVDAWVGTSNGRNDAPI
jgi:hypothetical protein